MRSTILGSVVGCISKRAELCPLRGAPPRPSAPSGAPLLRSVIAPPAGTPPHSPQARQRDAACGQRSPACVPRAEAAPPSLAGPALCAPVGGWRQGPSRCSPHSLVLPPHAQAQTVKTLVTNAKQTHVASAAHVVGAIGGSQFSRAQRYTASNNEGGDTLFTVQVHIKEYTGIDEVNARTYSADASDKPRNSFYALTNPCLVMGGSLNTFNARSNATFVKAKQSFVAMKTTSRSLQIGLRVNDEFPGQI